MIAAKLLKKKTLKRTDFTYWSGASLIEYINASWIVNVYDTNDKVITIKYQQQQIIQSLRKNVGNWGD